MAHNISRIDGTDQAWYADKPAWHGLGVTTPGAKSAAQVVRAVPAFRQPVITVPVAIRVGGRWVEQDDMVATVRRGSSSAMGYVSPGYEKLTDEDAVRTLEAVITVAGERKAKAGFVTAGLLGAKGARGFASIDLTRVFGNDLRVKGDPSRQECFLFGDWTHDGTAAMHAGLWNNRVECNNMLDMANAHATKRGLLARIVHKGDLQAQIAEAQRILGLAEVTARQHTAFMTQLVQTAIKPKWLREFAEFVVAKPTDDDTLGKRGQKIREDHRDLILGLYRNAPDLIKVPQSAYRAHQAVVDFADHHRPLRIGADTPTEVAADRRFRSITEGPAADLKDRSLEFIRSTLLASAN